MDDNFKGFSGFWRGVFSDEDGAPSCSRVCTGLIVAVSAAWVTHLVWHNHQLPDFAGLALFIGTLYGLNQLHSVLTSKKNGA